MTSLHHSCVLSRLYYEMYYFLLVQNSVKYISFDFAVWENISSDVACLIIALIKLAPPLTERNATATNHIA